MTAAPTEAVAEQADHATKHLACMEVWGGNAPIDAGVIMAGLDAWVFSKPAAGSDTGGDVHYVSSCAAGQITRLLVADVAGHGASASATAAHLRSLMRRYIIYHDQTRLFAAVNKHFTTHTRSAKFATALVATFDAPTNHLSLSNAGHPPPLYYSTRKKQWSTIDRAAAALADPLSQNPSDLPLGIDDLSTYNRFDLRLTTGDLILCYTDSLPESLDAAGQPLDTPGLLRLLQSLDPAEPSALITALLEGISSLNPRNLTTDDTTVLLFRPNGLRPYIPLRDRLIAPFRFAKGMIASYIRP
jgi:serine phosphatase RsbU (regulator of sigma subunit)